MTRISSAAGYGLRKRKNRFWTEAGMIAPFVYATGGVVQLTGVGAKAIASWRTNPGVFGTHETLAVPSNKF
jgi:hypothetical protein